MQIVEFGPLTPQHRAELEGDEEDPFEVGGSTLRYRPKQQHVGVQAEDGKLVASAGTVVVEVEVAGERFPVVGLGGVIVNINHRGRGLARQVVEAAIARAQDLGPDFAMLFCLPDRMGLYERLGFAEIADEVRVEQSHGSVLMPDRSMWRPLRAGAQWPGGAVTVHSLPF